MLKRFWSAEPTLIIAFVNASIGLAIAFGLNVDAKQAAAINVVVLAFFAIINRSQVTSPASLEAMKPKDLAQAQNTPDPVQKIVQKLP